MKKKNLLVRFFSNIYVKNILLMGVVSVVLIAIVLYALNSYTKHNESIVVPSLKGLQVDDAKGILAAAGLEYEVIDSVYESSGVAGSILEQIPEGDSNVKKGRTVFLIIQAKAKQLVSIPPLKDYSTRQAQALLASLGFKNITIKEVPSAYAGVVISVLYRGKEVTPDLKIPKGSPIVLEVGMGGSGNNDSIQTDEEPDNSQNIEQSFFE